MQELIIIIYYYIDALWRAGEEFEETADGPFDSLEAEMPASWQCYCSL